MRTILLLLPVFVVLASAQPDTAWVRKYDSPASDDDWGAHLAIDAHDRLIVAGSSDHNPDPDIANFDFLTVEYDNQGRRLWVSRYNGPGNDQDSVVAVSVDSSGNVYVAGSSWGTGTAYDFALVRYDSAGSQRWVARYAGDSGSANDFVKGMCIDSSGCAYLTGPSWRGDSAQDDYATVKFNRSGARMWATSYGGLESASSDKAYAVAVDHHSSVFVTGSSGLYPNYDAVTVKYDSLGQEVWVARYVGLVDTSRDEGHAILPDEDGGAYVAGWSGVDPNYDYFIIHYDSTGDSVWADRYDGPGHLQDRARILARDASGNLYVSGAGIRYDPLDYGYVTIKYTSTGVRRWVARYDGCSYFQDGATAIAFDSADNVYVTGGSESNVTNFDFATVKYDTSGNQCWALRYTNSGDFCEIATGVVLDSRGNVYVAGEGCYGDAPPWYDIILIKYGEPNAVNERPPTGAARLSLPVQTVVRTTLTIEDPRLTILSDITGRSVAGLHLGANDVSRLAPGVYFVCEDPESSRHRSLAVRKVVLTW
jgi:hypothetical protein